MSDAPPPSDGVDIVVNGRPITARKGELIIAAAARHDVYIPHFCYHPRMESVGMCRQCLVEVDTGRGPALTVSCMIAVAPGMVVNTESAATKRAQEGILELLLINHPLDCPVCDKGGECPLQDQTLAFGPGESRFVEEKRHYEKPIALSSLVLLDRERCVLCDRCTRFAKDVAGDPLIHFTERGNQTQVLTFPDEPFSSYFSGNTVQLCPVGALTAAPYRFKARPWDLEEQESTCTSCALGCRITVQSSRNQVLRYQGVDIESVNWGWLCDRGRFSFDGDFHADRLRAPMVRRGAELVDATWSTALTEAAAAITDALAAGGPSSVAVLGGARGSNEDAYAWAKLAKGIIGTDHVDAQLGDGLDPSLVLGLPPATIAQACAADTVVVLGPDLKEELPVLFLRLRDAITRRGAKLVELGPTAGGLTSLASVSLRSRPGELAALVRAVVGNGSATTVGADDASLEQARALLGRGSLVVIVGRSSLSESPSFVADAVAALAGAYPEATFLPVLRRGNVRGALELGLSPGLLPGRVSLDEGRATFAAAWGSVPTQAGLDATGILTAAAEGRIECLILLGADPLSDFPDRQLAEQALAGAKRIVAVDTGLSASSRLAHVVLAAAGFAEKAGTTTNVEGRVGPLAQQVTPPGTARPDWMIAAELARRLGADLGVGSVTDLQREIGALAPVFAGFGPTLVASGALHEGVVVPLPSTRVTLPATEVSTAEAPAAEVPAADAPAEAGSDGVAEPLDDATAAEAAQAAAADADDRADAEEAEEAEAGPPAQAGPTYVRFAAPPEATPLPPVDAYSLRLVVGRKLFDAGVVTTRSTHLAGLAQGTSVHLSAHDFDQLGVAEGDDVRVSSPRANIVVPVRRDPGVPRGSAWLPFNQPDVAAASLLDVGQPVTDVRVERV